MLNNRVNTQANKKRRQICQSEVNGALLVVLEATQIQQVQPD